jgi:GT2 family glycosyltransferase
MKIGIGIITYNRPDALIKMLDGLLEHCGKTLDYIVISDDGSKSENVKSVVDYMDSMYVEAERFNEYKHGKVTYIDNRKNVGVAGNSNRVIYHLFELGCDFMIIANDDLIIKGDAVKLYVDTHMSTNINLFCFRKWSGSSSDYVTNFSKELFFLYRVTGHWMSITRTIVDKVGYFDTNYGRFGEEHVDYVYRAMISGAANYPADLFRGSLDPKRSLDVLDIQDVKQSLGQSDLMYYHTIASAYHKAKWNKKVQIKEEYKEE